MSTIHSIIPIILLDLPLSDKELKLCKIKWKIISIENIYKDEGCAKFYKLIIVDNKKYYKVNVVQYDKKVPSCEFAYSNWKFSSKIWDYYYFWVIWHSNDINWYSTKNYDALKDLPVCTENQIKYKETSKNYSILENNLWIYNNYYLIFSWVLLLSIITYFIYKKLKK